MSKDPERQPKWLPQALQVLERAAATNPVAKDFLAFSANALAPAAKAPETANATNAAETAECADTVAARPETSAAPAGCVQHAVGRSQAS